jgi:hypothetical protein
MTKESISKSPSGRPTRTPVASRSVLNVKGQEPGYHYRIVNDDDDRIESFKGAGYEVVLAKDVKIGDRRVEATSAEGTAASTSVGGGKRGIVMRIKKEWYDEDQALKQKQIQELEDSMKQRAKESSDYGTITLT